MEVAVPDAAIVRTSLVLTPEVLDPRTRFVADAVRAGRPVDLYEDEVRMPVHRDDLADALWRLVARDRGARVGVWHLVGEVALSRFRGGVIPSGAESARHRRPPSTGPAADLCARPS